MGGLTTSLAWFTDRIDHLEKKCRDLQQEGQAAKTRRFLEQQSEELSFCVSQQSHSHYQL